MSNYYYESIPNTPLGVLVLPHIQGGYLWFITVGEEHEEANSVIKCTSPLKTPYEAVEDALVALSSGLSGWIIYVADKRRDWADQKG